MKIRKYEMNRRDLEPFIRDVHKKKQVMHYNIKPQLSIELNWGSIKFFLTVYFLLTSST